MRPPTQQKREIAHSREGCAAKRGSAVGKCARTSANPDLHNTVEGRHASPMKHYSCHLLQDRLLKNSKTRMHIPKQAKYHQTPKTY